MKFFGKFYIWYLLFAFIVGGILAIVFKDMSFLGFMLFTVFVWATIVVVERLIDDYRHFGREFFVGFDVMELSLISVMTAIMFKNFLNSLRDIGSTPTLLLLMVVTFGFLIVLMNVRSNLLKLMVHHEWDSKFNLVKSTVDKVLKGNVVDMDSASMVSKILVLKLDWSLRSTAKAVGKSHVTVKRYLERKDSKLVD
jgi:hypothetical protein